MSFATVGQGHVHPWSPQYMNGIEQIDQARAVADAEHFSVIAANPTTYKNHLGAMRAANPEVSMLVYWKGVMTPKGDQADSIYAHDRAGNKVRGKLFPNTYLLEPTSPGALTYHVQEGKALLGRSGGFDGLFLDTIGVAPLGRGYMQSIPVNPKTGADYTADEWQKATSKFAGAIKQQIGCPCMGNGIRDGGAFFKSTAATSIFMQVGLDGMMAEGWLRGGGNAVDRWPSETLWRQSVDMIGACEGYGGSFFGVTKVWVPATQAQFRAWVTYAIASFLMGTSGGKSFVNVSANQKDLATWRPEYALDLGDPTGPYAKLSNVYQRSFAGGRVLVNPSKTGYTIALGESMKRLDGTSVSTLSMQPNGAEILLVG